MFEFRWGAATDVGRVRTNNEDAMLVSRHLFAVADGMGGHQGGEVASDLALQTLESTFTEPTTDGLLEAARDANDAVYERGTSDPELHGMGTTLVAIAPMDGADAVAWINIGDSRLYLLRDGELTQVSEDHSWVQEAVRAGDLTPEEAQVHPQRNIVTRALGLDPGVAIDGDRIDCISGDRYLLCSDGLYDYVDDGRIAATLRRLDDPDEAARDLVRQANEGGGRDNITVVIVDATSDDDPAATASRVIDKETAEGHAPAADAVASTTSRRQRRREAKASRPRRVTWRVLLFVILFVVVLAGAAAAVGYYARNTYYVGFKNDAVVIFKGKPGGVLWFKPTVEEVTVIHRNEVVPAQVDRVEAGHEESTLQGAHDYVTNLTTTTTTTSTTTTTVASTSTVPQIN